MEKIQEKLKDCIEKRSNMESLDRVADILDQSQPTNDDGTMTTTTTTAAGGAAMMDTTSINTTEIDADDVARSHRGENKAPVVKRGKRKSKHTLRSSETKRNKKKFNQEGGGGDDDNDDGTGKTKRRPRFFVQF